MIETYLNEVSLNDLIRVYNSNKDFVYFDISVFNAGTVIRLNCTNIYKKPYNNGYDFIVDNDFYFNELLFDIIEKKFNELTISWSKSCYYYPFEDFLKKYNLTLNKYNTINKLIKKG